MSTTIDITNAGLGRIENFVKYDTIVLDVDKGQVVFKQKDTPVGIMLCPEIFQASTFTIQGLKGKIKVSK